MSRTGIKMRSGAYAASRQDAEAGGYQDFRPRSITKGPAVLTSVCIRADLRAAPCC